MAMLRLEYQRLLNWRQATEAHGGVADDEPKKPRMISYYVDVVMIDVIAVFGKPKRVKLAVTQSPRYWV